MKNPKTTWAAILTATASLLSMASEFLTSGKVPDVQALLMALSALVAAVGLWHAADGGK